MNRIPRSLAVALAAVLVCAMGVAIVRWSPDVVARLTYAAESGQAAAAKEHLETARDLSEAFRHVAKALKPSVVSINAVTHIKPAAGRERVRPMPDNVPEEFRRFFDDDTLNRFFDFRVPERGFEQRGFGTGVLISNDGYILTNNHVVGRANSLKVTLSDGREFPATVVGTDEKTDLAVVKIDAHDLVPAELGDSDKMEVGDWVLAIGGPFGLSQSVTAGIISAKERANVGITDYEDFLQTDAAINPGNSGGPLVNLNGQVIGINTAIASRNGGYMGVGFAIPSNMARSIMESILKSGHVERGWLGAAIQDLNKDLARSFDYKSTEGVLVSDVVAGSPAEKAGLKSGDIVTKFDGKPMRDANLLRHTVASTAPKSRVDMTVFRGGKEMTLHVVVGRLEGQAALGEGAAAGEENEAAAEDLGLTVRTLTPELASELGYDEHAQGAVVTQVESSSPAQEVGVRARDVITMIGNTKVKDADSFREAMKAHKLADGIRMTIKRDGVQRFVFLKSS